MAWPALLLIAFVGPWLAGSPAARAALETSAVRFTVCIISLNTPQRVSKGPRAVASHPRGLPAARLGSGRA